MPRLRARDYLDLALSIDLADSYNLSFGVDNIGDDQQQANTCPSIYDPLGRDYHVAVRFRF